MLSEMVTVVAEKVLLYTQAEPSLGGRTSRRTVTVNRLIDIRHAFEEPNQNGFWPGPSSRPPVGAEETASRRSLRFRLSPPASRCRLAVVGVLGNTRREGQNCRGDGKVVQGVGHGARQVSQRDRLRQGAEKAVQGVRRGEGAQHYQRVRWPAGDLLQL